MLHFVCSIHDDLLWSTKSSMVIHEPESEACNVIVIFTVYKLLVEVKTVISYLLSVIFCNKKESCINLLLFCEQCK